MRPWLPLLALLLIAPAARADLSVGFAAVDVTPDVAAKPVFLAGFGQNRKAARVADPIMARAVVLSDGTTTIALVSVDVVGLFLPAVERVRAKLPNFKYVLVSSTHNHEGPDTLGLWGASPFQSGVDPDYITSVVDGAAEAVTKADAARKPARAVIGTAAAPELLHDARKPEVKHDELVALKFTAADTDKPLGILVQWNCHPETLDSKNTAVTADYVGYTARHLADAHGCPVAYFTGTVGGLMTSLHVPVADAAGTPLKDGTFEKAERYGRLLGGVADRALKAAVPVALTPFDVRTAPVLVPVDNALYKVAKQAGVLKRAMYPWAGDPAAKDPAETQDVTKPVAVRTEVGYLRLGDLEVAAVPGEVYPELVLGKVQDPPDPGADFPDAPPEPALYAQLSGKHRMLIGLANDEIGYIIPKRQWDKKPPFCYGLKSDQYGEDNSVGPDAAGVICGAFKNLAKPARP